MAFVLLVALCGAVWARQLRKENSLWAYPVYAFVGFLALSHSILPMWAVVLCSVWLSVFWTNREEVLQERAIRYALMTSPVSVVLAIVGIKTAPLFALLGILVPVVFWFFCRHGPKITRFRRFRDWEGVGKLVSCALVYGLLAQITLG